MANVKIGSYASWNSNFIESLSTTKQLTRGDSGKIFMVDQSSVAFTVNLPKVSSDMCGWNCKFYLRAAGSGVVSVVGFGSVAAGGSTLDDHDLMVMQIIAGDSNDSDSYTAAATGQDGFTFINGAAIGDTVSIFTDGTTWYAEAITAQNAHVGVIDS